jgi:hypothetical protein
MFHMLTFRNSWKENEGIQAPLWNGMFTKAFQAKQMSSNQLLKTTWGIRGKHLWQLTFFIYLIHIPRCNHLHFESFLV